MPQSIVSTLNQPIIYRADDDVTCKCGERENCILVAAGQQVYSQLKILPCGTFEVCNNSLGAELICNGGFDLGDELVTNGTFTGSATGWTVPANWSYFSNKVCAIAVAAGQTLLQNIPSITAGKFYYVVYTVTNYSAGDVRVTLGGTDGGTRSADGTYAELLKTVAGNDLSFNRVTGDFTGCIDDVSVKLLDCWELSAEWTWNSGAMCLATAPANLTQDIPSIINGTTYQLAFTISDYVTGTLTAFVGGGNGAAISADGTYVQYITSNGANTLLDFVDASSFEGCIDDISLKEVTICWDADETDWLINSTGACHETGNTTDLTNTGTSVVSGKYYHVTISVTNATAGGINIVLGTTVLTPQTSGNGIFDFWGVSNGTALIVRPTTDFDGCISEVSADEYCNEYEFHLIRSEGDEYVVQDMTEFYILTEDVFNLTDFTFDERLAYGCYRFCLVDCCSEQQTAASLLRNGDFASGALYWTSQNMTFSGGVATFTSGFETNLLEQALITTHDADCIELQFTFGNEAVAAQLINIYINGVLVDSELLASGAGAYSNTFQDVPAGAVIRFVTGELAGDIIIDNIVVTVPEECQPIYDQCTPCINYQASFQCTKLVEGYCDGNAFGFEFDDSNGNNQFKLSLRAKCELLHPTYAQEQEDYDFSTGSSNISFGQSAKFQSLTFFPLPEYKHDVIALEKVCDTFQIDTVDYFVKKGDYTPEWNKSSSTDLAPSRIDVKKKDQTLFNTNC